VNLQRREEKKRNKSFYFYIYGENIMNPTVNKLVVVGIGASAGGLESYKHFFSTMPVKSGMAFILIQHLNPHYPSIMDKLVARSTFMPVKQIEDKMPVRANHVYVIPPNKFLKIKHGILKLGPPEPFIVRKPIDAFFRSLAEDKEEKAIAIILSGAGNDGVEGCRVIKERDGLIIAQDPDTAAFSSMPQSLVSAGLADHILPIGKMPDILIRHTLYTENLNFKISKDLNKKNADLNFILAQVKKKTQDDFSPYKKVFLLRHIHKRMERSKVKQLSGYGQLLEENSSEIDQLHKDFMIGSTSFFRNPECFETLDQKVQAQITDESSFRVWIPACSTGEEAYSIAMLLREKFAYQAIKIQIFATDINEAALKFARQGLYSRKIEAQTSPKRLEKFFDKVGNNYRIKPELRETVIFTRHNLVSDIPFCKLNLISCRNLFPYLEQEKQREILKLFHFSLKEGGYLFFGLSEKMEQEERLFEMIFKESCLFKRIALLPRMKELQNYQF
jgi:two-component system CheB/CheR fusion protein